MDCGSSTVYFLYRFQKIRIAINLNDLESSYSRDFLITFSAYCKKYRVIFIDAPRFSVYGGVVIMNIAFQLD